MAQLVYPGVMFTAIVVREADAEYCGLPRTVSTYQYGDRLQTSPKRNEVYVMCQDGSIQSVFDPTLPIGWELIEDNSEFFYRVTQVGHEPKKFSVFYHGKLNEIPAGTGHIGSKIAIYRRIVEQPESAVIEEQGDDGEPEVNSVM